MADMALLLRSDRNDHLSLKLPSWGYSCEALHLTPVVEGNWSCVRVLQQSFGGPRTSACNPTFVTTARFWSSGEFFPSVSGQRKSLCFVSLGIWSGLWVIINILEEDFRELRDQPSFSANSPPWKDLNNSRHVCKRSGWLSSGGHLPLQTREWPFSAFVLSTPPRWNQFAELA